MWPRRISPREPARSAGGSGCGLEVPHSALQLLAHLRVGIDLVFVLIIGQERVVVVVVVAAVRGHLQWTEISIGREIPAQTAQLALVR